MPDIDISAAAYRELERLAVAWDCGLTQAADRLIIGVATGVRSLRPRPASRPVAIHAVYAGTRIDATFDVESCAVTVCTGLLCGQTYTSPSGARRAVVAVLNPTVSPGGNGWTFWTVTATGAHLDTLRR
jgi:hypothetical protein